MKIEVFVKPNARKNRLEKTPDGQWVAYLAAAPVDGKANEALIELLSEHFGVRKSAIAILRGQRARKKLLEIQK